MPWVWKVIEEFEEWDTAKLKVTLDERDRCLHGWIDAFKQRVTEHFRTTMSPYFTSIHTEIERLWS